MVTGLCLLGLYQHHDQGTVQVYVAVRRLSSALKLSGWKGFGQPIYLWNRQDHELDLAEIGYFMR
ncbi:hypothetical protein FEMY_10200 [Ferrovum myxofaciens]|jgi:hypothetical protein|uniref:Uncharacterized protein n=1 Tax=Ferrovum myxofaciens TaxID=416213 RepID=A0A149VYW1_9PROT|nr:hypothetical protein FEMY_10200 [Ferrovum myxofaciens]